MSEALNTAAAHHHLPAFIAAPGHSDWLMNLVIVLLVVIVLAVGNLYLRLHSLPERMAHRANVVQFEVVAVLALIALFTHNNIFWVAALLLALIRIPDFSGPLTSIAGSLERMAGGPEPQARPPSAAGADAPPGTEPAPATEPVREPVPAAGVAEREPKR